MRRSEDIYLAAVNSLLWSESDDQGDSLSDKYDEENIPKEIRDRLQDEVDQFVEENKKLIEKSGLDREQIGHDFVLTRNRHGAGFWDRGLGKVGDQLTEAAHKYGEIHMYEDGEGGLEGDFDKPLKNPPIDSQRLIEDLKVDADHQEELAEELRDQGKSSMADFYEGSAEGLKDAITTAGIHAYKYPAGAEPGFVDEDRTRPFRARNPETLTAKGERMYEEIKRGYEEKGDPRAKEIAARTVYAKAAEGVSGLVKNSVENPIRGTWGYTKDKQVFIPERRYLSLKPKHVVHPLRGSAHTLAVEEDGKIAGWMLKEDFDKGIHTNPDPEEADLENEIQEAWISYGRGQWQDALRKKGKNIVKLSIDDLDDLWDRAALAYVEAYDESAWDKIGRSVRFRTDHVIEMVE